jgi:hypothetical protein
MHFILFSIFSSIEIIAMFAIMFALFRFEYPFYHVNVLFIAVMMSFVSFSLHYGFNMSSFSTFIHFLLLILFFSLLYRQHLFYAAIAVTISFVIYGLIQFGIIIIADFSGVMEISEIEKEFSKEGMLIQFISVVVAMLIFYLIKRYKKGFSFLPHTNRISIQWTSINASILVLVVLTSGLIGFMYYYLNINNYSGLYILSFILLFSLVYLLYLSTRKDKML